MSRATKHLLWLVCLLGVTACGRDTSELEAYIAEVKARKSSVVEPIPQIRQYEPFEYVPAERRDPFTPQAQDAPDSGPSPENSIRPDANRNREALEEFPLDSLRMVGTLSTPRATYVLIRAPDGIVHRVSVGNYLGQNYGKITRITEAEVTLEEIIPDGFGGFMQRSASIALSEN
ncbi:pilus assembly protein PilP [uncultured Abyssibacter sp.]|uniref:pilus assembly protein PilP n=1 Tax=uncultured Abyssibacter sp. TaxID=2320202 RepID=UPI0032B25070